MRSTSVITAENDESVHVALGVTEVERIDHHADVGGVLAGLAHMGNLDEFKGGFVEVPLELLVAIEVAVGLLDDDVAFEQEPFDHLLNVEGGIMGVAGTERDVL